MVMVFHGVGTYLYYSTVSCHSGVCNPPVFSLQTFIDVFMFLPYMIRYVLHNIFSRLLTLPVARVFYQINLV